MTKPFVNTPQTGNQISELGSSTDIWAPAMKILTQINGENVIFNTLTDYINRMFGKSEFLYETKYDITVPYWSGFATSDEGIDPDWRNIQLGSKLIINDTIRVYNQDTEEWEEIVTDDQVFSVLEIERSSEKAETKLVCYLLKANEPFNYYNPDKYEGETLQGIEEDSQVLPTSRPSLADAGVEYYQCGESIASGEAVRIMADNKIYRANSNKTNYEKTIGIAQHAGVLNDIIPVKTGRIFNPNYSFNVGSQVFVVSNTTGLNISQDLSLFPQTDYDLLVILGVADTENSFIWDKQEFIWTGN